MCMYISVFILVVTKLHIFACGVVPEPANSHPTPPRDKSAGIITLAIICLIVRAELRVCAYVHTCIYTRT